MYKPLVYSSSPLSIAQKSLRDKYVYAFDVNIAELANNKDLQSLTASIYGDTVPGLECEYLQYITANFNINAGGIFTASVSLEAELKDIDPGITPARFPSLASYRYLLEYVTEHANEQPIQFNY